jgi:hypothetical protein
MNDGIQKSPIRQQHEFVFLLTPDFRQFVDFKFSCPKRTAVSTEFKQNETENLLSDPCRGEKPIRGMAMGPQSQECACWRCIGVGIARWDR